MPNPIVDEATRLLQQSFPEIDANTKYMLLASFIMYFKSPLKGESWNTFPQRVSNRAVSVRDALLSTDEQKNPEYWNAVPAKEKSKRHKDLVANLLTARDKLVRKRVFAADPRTQATVVPVSDPTTPHSEPTFFPVDYLRDQINQGNYINELTGRPFSWIDVEQVRTPHAAVSSLGAPFRSVAGAIVLKGVTHELEQIKQSFEICAVCRKRTRQFKTLRDYRTVYFCSLDCLGKWDG